MLNIHSIRCSLSFAPYLADAMAGYLDGKGFHSRVVKQGGNGLILHSDAEMGLRFQVREARLGHEDARHYAATIAYRRDFYDITRMADEIVIANIGESLLLSHPQSELWLDANVIKALLRAYDDRVHGQAADEALPDWLNVSTGAGHLLLSDQRTGRWVLLGADHRAELERRVGLLARGSKAPARQRPPTLAIKGVMVHLQTAFRLADALEGFSASGHVEEFIEQAPGYELAVERATEGMAVRDFDQRAALTAREARKYAAILRHELEQRRALQFERGRLRTVMADDGGGRWVLQWGDEVLLTGEAAASWREANHVAKGADLVMRRDGEFFLLLTPATGACVALTDREAQALQP